MKASDKARMMGWSVTPGQPNPAGEVIAAMIRRWNKEALNRLLAEVRRE